MHNWLSAITSRFLKVCVHQIVDHNLASTNLQHFYPTFTEGCWSWEGCCESCCGPNGCQGWAHGRCCCRSHTCRKSHLRGWGSSNKNDSRQKVSVIHWIYVMMLVSYHAAAYAASRYCRPRLCGTSHPLCKLDGQGTILRLNYDVHRQHSIQAWYSACEYLTNHFVWPVMCLRTIACTCDWQLWTCVELRARKINCRLLPLVGPWSRL